MASGRVSVRLPRALLQYWDGPPELDVEAKTLAETLEQLEKLVPGLGGRIQDDQGRLRRHVAVFVNGAMLEETDPSAVALKAGDSVRIVPAVSGG
jgi:sulfur-carrier protein